MRDASEVRILLSPHTGNVKETRWPCTPLLMGSIPIFSTGDWCQRFNTSAFQAEALGSNPRSPTMARRSTRRWTPDSQSGGGGFESLTGHDGRWRPVVGNWFRKPGHALREGSTPSPSSKPSLLEWSGACLVSKSEWVRLPQTAPGGDWCVSGWPGSKMLWRKVRLPPGRSGVKRSTT